MIFHSSVAHLAPAIKKNHQILQNVGENEEKSFNYSIIQMAAFGTKNVHSALLFALFLNF